MKKVYNNGLNIFCPVCGKEFEKASPNKKFCSKVCNNKFHNNKGKEISVPLTPSQLLAIRELQKKFIRENIEKAIAEPQKPVEPFLPPESSSGMDKIENALEGK